MYKCMYKEEHLIAHEIAESDEKYGEHGEPPTVFEGLFFGDVL